MFRGFGTVLNVVAVLVGSGLGVLIGHRLPSRTRDVVTDALGLVVPVGDLLPALFVAPVLVQLVAFLR